MPDLLTIQFPRPWSAGPFSLAPVHNAFRIIGGARQQILADIHPTAARVALPNGRLFVSSPDLFEALVELLSDQHRDDLESVRLSHLCTSEELTAAVARIGLREQAGRDALRKALGQEAHL